MPTVKAAALILDFGVYPRQHLDDTNVRSIAAARDAGEKIPPVVADKTSRRVSDGFHRVTEALRRDRDATIDVQWVDYPDDQALFLDAVRRNARHGVKLSSYDQARCLIVASELAIDPAAIADALAIPPAVAGKIKDSRTAFRSDGKPTTIKRSFRHLKGQRLTAAEEAANDKASGWSARFHADQIILLIEAGAVDLEDAALRSTLSRLHGLLDDQLTKTAA